MPKCCGAERDCSQLIHLCGLRLVTTSGHFHITHLHLHWSHCSQTWTPTRHMQSNPLNVFFFIKLVNIKKKKTYSIQYCNKMWIKWNVTRLQAGTECFEQPCLNWSWRRWTEKCSWLLQQLIDPFIQWSFDYSHFMDAFLCKWKSKWSISFQECFISLRARARTVTSFGV